MITSNSDTFGIFGLKILKQQTVSLRQSDAGAPVQPQLVFLGDASPKSGAEAAATDVQGVKDYSEGMLRPGNVYNLQGRCVATEEMVKDGTWKNNLTPGVYIMSGKKIIVK